MSNIITAIKEQLATSGRSRILAFGSSNTDRYLYGMHWFDVVHIGMRSQYGTSKHFINTGISGNTTKDLLERFEEDAAFYKPSLAFVTIGGNDSNPAKNISGFQFKENLILLQKNFSELGTLVIFQTYYSPDPALVEKKHMNDFYTYMDIVREVAASTNSGLVDHLKRWEHLRLADDARYQKMMLNSFHVNQTGNILMGLDILRTLEIQIPENDFRLNPIPALAEALENQSFIDKLISK